MKRQRERQAYDGERKKLVVWLDDDGETHISNPERYGEEDFDLLFVIEFEEEPMFFSNLAVKMKWGVALSARSAQSLMGAFTL